MLENVTGVGGKKNEVLRYEGPFDGSTRGCALRTLEASVINGVLVLGS